MQVCFYLSSIFGWQFYFQNISGSFVVDRLTCILLFLYSSLSLILFYIPLATIFSVHLIRQQHNLLFDILLLYRMQCRHFVSDIGNINSSWFILQLNRIIRERGKRMRWRGGKSNWCTFRTVWSQTTVHL